MKTLHVITGLGQGGAERQLTNLLSLGEHGAVFSIMYPGAMAKEIEFAGCPIFSGYARSSISLGWVNALRRAIWDYQPDVVMGWMYHGNLAASLTRLLGHRGPILWNVRHSVHDIRLEKASTRFIIKACAQWTTSPVRIVYNSYSSARQHEDLGYASDKRTVIPNGFDLERFKPNVKASLSFRSELGIPQDRLLLGVVSRSHPMKNLIGWLEALRNFMQDGIPFHCVMVGTGVSNPGGDLFRAVRELGLESHVTLLPPTDQPEILYPSLDLLVMPSLWGEGFPNVVGEAMACGVPALVTNVGDSSTLVGNTGFVANSGEPVVLVNCLRHASSCGREHLAYLGRQARSRMMDFYSLESVSSRYQSLINDVKASL